MNKEATLGLEFEYGKEEGSPVKEVSRSCFRVPVNKSDTLSIQIGKIAYPIVNMHTGGIAFRIQAGKGYFPVENERIDATITLKNRVFDVQVQVVHISDDEEEDPLCGLRFVSLDAVTAEAICTVYEVLKKRLLLNEGGSV